MLRDHLADCDHCRRLEEELRSLQYDLSWLSVEPPPHLAVNIMARIRAETAPTVPTAVPTHHKKTFRRWFSAAAVFVLMISATIIGSQVLPMDRGGNAAPATMGLDQTQLNKAASREASGCQDAISEIGLLPVPGAPQPTEAAPTSDLPEPEANVATQYNDGSTPKASISYRTVSGAGDGTSADDKAQAYMETEESGDTSSSTFGAAGESANTVMKDAPTYQAPSPESSDIPEEPSASQPTSPDTQGLTLDTKSAEALLFNQLSLSPSNPATITYEGLSPAGDAHLFLVTWPKEQRETYSVNRATGAVTLLPTSESQSPPAS